MKKSLEASEWILALGFLILLAALLIFSRCHEHRIQSKLSKKTLPEEISFELTISGEVTKPGVFVARAGTRLGDVIKKSQPKRFADLRSLDLDAPVEAPLKLVISSLNELNVRIVGAVTHPFELQVVPGSRICDLKSKISCSEDADLKFFKRRRFLKDREEICIPRKFAQEEEGTPALNRDPLK